MATNKTTVSIYPDDDLLDALKSFQSQGNYKSLNVAAIAILREKLLGDVSSTLESKVSSTLNIQSMIDERIADIQEAIEDKYRALFAGISGNINDLMQQRDREIDALSARIEELSSEAIATAKKPLMLSPQLRAIALQKLSQAA
jgi:hypothetical protein